MSILRAIREATGQSMPLKKGFKAYMKLKEEVDLLKESLSLLSMQQEATKNHFNKALEANPLRLAEFNKRFNASFEDYISKVEEIKKSHDEKKLLMGHYKEITIGLDDWLSKLIEYDNLLESKEYKYKKFLKDGLGLYRKDLPQFSYKDIQDILVKLGREGIIFSKVSIPIDLIKPSQIDFCEEKIQNLLNNGIDDENFVPIISKDLFLIDGHHRWAQKLEEDDQQIIDAFYINMKAVDLIENLKKEEEKDRARELLKRAEEAGLI